jgi:hypothetical protein
MAEIPVAVPDSVIITERQSAMAGSGVGDCLTARFFSGRTECAVADNEAARAERVYRVALPDCCALPILVTLTCGVRRIWEKRGSAQTA